MHNATLHYTTPAAPRDTYRKQRNKHKRMIKALLVAAVEAAVVVAVAAW